MNSSFSPGLAWTMPLYGRRLIEASAGTGKTYTIADLVLRLVLGDAIIERVSSGGAPAAWEGPAVSIDRLLVVTFTKAAAAELRERIRRRLRDAAAGLDGACPDDDPLWPWLRERLDTPALELARQRLGQALADLDLARISTIHGFCQTILREQALATGAGPDVDVVGADDPRLERIARDYWLRTVGAPSADPELAEACVSVLGGKAITHLIRLGAEALQQRHDVPLAVLPEAPLAPTAERVQQWFQQFLNSLNKRWDHEQRASRALTYGDLQRTLERALAEHPPLARDLRARFPVALVDEFQDTDPVQWAIFERIWPQYGDREFDRRSPSLLAMIGDPKQAIYRFRGGDIHTYMAARSKADGEPSALDVNYRSDRGLVEALQAWLGQPAHEGSFGRGIRWSTVRAAHATRLGPPGTPAVVLDWIAEPFRVGAVPRLVVGWVREILDRERLEIDGQPLGYGDIAVLVPAASKGRAVHAALTEAGIPAALQTRSSVFSVPMARHLLELLRSVLAPEDVAALAAALATPLVGRTASTLRADRADERAWRRWIEALAEIGHLWRQDGPAPALVKLLDGWPVDDAGRSIRERILTWPDALRAATDLQHLVDLLVEQAHLGHLGLAALIRWLEQRIAGVEDENVAEETAQLRIERAGGAVKILTIHASKGLEFPIVLLPYLTADKGGGVQFPWTYQASDDPAEPRTGVWLAVDNPNSGKKGDAWRDEGKAVRARIDQENMAEEHRLLYVALTRAAHQVRMFWYRAGSSKSRAISLRIMAAIEGAAVGGVAPALHNRDHYKWDGDRRAEVQHEIAAVFAALNSRLGTAGWRIRPWRPIGSTGGSVPPALDMPGAEVEAEEASTSYRTVFPAVPGRHWRQHSFTSLRRGARRDGDRGFGVAPRIDDAEADAGPIGNDPETIWPAEFGGARAGHVVHEVFEDAWREPALLQSMAREDGWREGGLATQRLRTALRNGGFRDHDELAAPLGRCLHDVLTTPILLDAGGPPLRLGEIDCLVVPELGFLAPLRGEDGGSGGWRTQGLAERLREAAVGDAEAERLSGWIGEILGGDDRTIEGMLTGFIDLVFEHQGRLWLLDWKSNRLPDVPDAGGRIMAESGYGLQALLYALAARRLLVWRGRDPDRDFGGILYVFLRAFGSGDVEATVRRGVVCLRPGAVWLAAAEKEMLERSGARP